MAADVTLKRVDNETSAARGATNTMVKECQIRARREQNHTRLNMFYHFIPTKHELRSGSVSTDRRRRRREIERDQGTGSPGRLPNRLTSCDRVRGRREDTDATNHYTLILQDARRTQTRPRPRLPSPYVCRAQ